MERPPSRAEWIADAVVHVLGVAAGIAGTVALGFVALPQVDLPKALALGCYAGGLLAMLACSALYNMWPEGGLKGLFRRFDHAAIFLMIAGTYTPIVTLAPGGAWGLGLLAFVWTAALAGAVLKLLLPGRFERLSVAAYLLLGWSVVPAFRQLTAALSPGALALIVAGGLLYSVGVLFHLWRRLRYQTAIWHGFVLAAAGCHFAAILGTAAAV